MPWPLMLLWILAVFPGSGSEPSGNSDSDAEPGLSGHRQLTVRVIDYASVGPDKLRKASTIAAAVFRKAGVANEWQWCASTEQHARGCLSTGADVDLYVKILAPGMEDARVSDHLLGTANRTISVAFIFYGHVRVSKLARNCHESELLASVMAHEVGHLLGLEHSARGMMRESFRPADIEQVAVDGLTFTNDQAVQARFSLAGLKAQ